MVVMLVEQDTSINTSCDQQISNCELPSLDRSIGFLHYAKYYVNPITQTMTCLNIITVLSNDLECWSYQSCTTDYLQCFKTFT